MNYKEKYEAALERAREIKSKILSSHLSTESCKAISEYIDEIIPELTESEDERIYNEIMEFFKMNEKRCIVDNSYTKWIAYLEKQKEQKDYRKLYEDIAKSEWFKKAYEGKSLGYDYEQKEQKPIDMRDRPFLGIVEDKLNYIVPSWYDGAQKPAEWSEEDKTFVKDAIEAVENYYSKGCGQEELVSWLKSLRPQPKQEWTEEDERMLSRCIKSIESSKQFGDNSETFKKAKDKEMDWLKTRLKSLRPQPQMLEDWTSEDDELLTDVLGCITLVQTYKACGDLKEFKMGHTGEELRSFIRSLKSRPRKQPHWKPSEEQMKALDYIAGRFTGSSKVFANFMSLYDDLKKLM